MQTQGVISNVSQKPWFDSKRNQNIVLHSFQLQGGGQWFRTGTTAPPPVGSHVIFSVGDRQQVNNMQVVGQAVVQTAAPAPAQRPAAPRGGYQSGGNRDDYWKQKEARDIEKDERYQAVDIPRMSYSAAQTAAVQLVSAALQHDCISFGNATKGKKFDILLQMVEDVALKLASNTLSSPSALAEFASNAPASSESGGQEDETYPEDY
jgi:hypothetical protein